MLDVKGFLLTVSIGVFFSVLISYIPSWYGRMIVMPEPPTQNEVLPLLSPERAQTIYGMLFGYPHMYEFSTIRTIRLEISLLVPEGALSRNNMTAIVLRVNDDGSVSEITRLKAKDALWKSVYEPFGGDWYRQGGSYGADLSPGLYRIEISTPDDIGKYVLKVGTKKEVTVGYFGLLRQCADIKMFFGVSSYRVLVAPVVYGPIALFVVVCGGALSVWRRKSTREKSVTI